MDSGLGLRRVAGFDFLGLPPPFVWRGVWRDPGTDRGEPFLPAWVVEGGPDCFAITTLCRSAAPLPAEGLSNVPLVPSIVRMHHILTHERALTLRPVPHRGHDRVVASMQ